MKRKKKSERKLLVDYLDGIWRWATKEILGRICWWCGSTERIQSDHIQNRHKYPTRWRIENCAILCFRCHFYRKKQNPAEWAQLVINRIGQDKWEELITESNRQDKTDLEAAKAYLEEVKRGLKEKNDENEDGKPS